MSPSLIKLCGRTITEIQLNPPAGGVGSPAGVQNLGANQFLKEQLKAENARLARIYGFSFEGHYYDLPRPVIMLVHGDGAAVTARQRSTMLARRGEIGSFPEVSLLGV